MTVAPEAGSPGDLDAPVSFMDLQDASGEVRWKPWQASRGKLWAIWKDFTGESTVAAAALRAEAEGVVEERRASLIRQRKELTGDEKHQFPEGGAQTKIVDEMFEPFMPLFDPDNIGQAQGGRV